MQCQFNQILSWKANGQWPMATPVPLGRAWMLPTEWKEEEADAAAEAGKRQHTARPGPAGIGIEEVASEENKSQRENASYNLCRVDFSTVDHKQMHDTDYRMREGNLGC